MDYASEVVRQRRRLKKLFLRIGCSPFLRLQKVKLKKAVDNLVPALHSMHKFLFWLDEGTQQNCCFN
jgi:hypothetical protein